VKICYFKQDSFKAIYIEQSELRKIWNSWEPLGQLQAGWKEAAAPLPC